MLRMCYFALPSSSYAHMQHDTYTHTTHTHRCNACYAHIALCGATLVQNDLYRRYFCIALSAFVLCVYVCVRPSLTAKQKPSV